MHGRRRLFIISISIFLLASGMCGLAQTMAQLIAFRALQGIGAGGLMTLAQTIISEVVPMRERARSQSLFTGSFAVASVAGPIVGGGLTTALSWRWVFYVNLSIGGLALIFILLGLRPLRRRMAHRIDYLGALFLATAATTAMLLFTWAGSRISWTSPWAAGLAIATILLGWMFIRQEKRTPEPVIDLALFRIRSFAVGVTTTGAMAFALMGAMVFLPLYFQLVLGLNAAEAGFMMLPQVAMMVVSSLAGGAVSSGFRTTKSLMVGGIALELLGLCILAGSAFVSAGIATFLIALSLLGSGMGIAMPSATVIVQNAAPRESLGTATAFLLFVRSLGGALGVAICSGVMVSNLGQDLLGLRSDFDVRALMDGGLGPINALPPDLRAAVTDTYANAIGFSLLISAFIMAIALFLSTGLRDRNGND